MPFVQFGQGLSSSPDSELREFLSLLGVQFPIRGRDIGSGFRVTCLNELAAKTFKAHNGQTVLLSFETDGIIYPLSIFFVEEGTYKFGHSTLILPQYESESILESLQAATRQFFSRPEDLLLSSLHPDWLEIQLTNIVDRRTYWDQTLGKEFSPEIPETEGLPKIPILPSVYHFNNPYFKHLLEIAVPEIKEGSRVLVMGCGAGLDALVLANKTKCPVDAVDINPLSVLNTLIAANRAGMSRYINAWQSDLFSEVHEKYDAIIFNAPLVVVARPDADPNRFDVNGTIIRRLLRDFPAYVNKGGRIYMMSHPDIEEYLPTGTRSKLRRHFKAVIEHGIHEVTVDSSLNVPKVFAAVVQNAVDNPLSKS